MFRPKLPVLLIKTSTKTKLFDKNKKTYKENENVTKNKHSLMNVRRYHSNNTRNNSPKPNDNIVLLTMLGTIGMLSIIKR